MKLDDSLGLFDLRADENASLSYEKRTYLEAQLVAGSAKVLEDARLWMPEDAAYRILRGRRYSAMGYSYWAQYFLNGFFLPRRQTSSEAARWVFCYACNPTTLGRIEVLSDGGSGLVFGRLKS